MIDDDEDDDWEAQKGRRKKRYADKRKFKEDKGEIAGEEGRKRPRKNLRWSDYEDNEETFYE